MEQDNGISYDATDASKLRDLGIYIHIPFCIKKCDYCDFLSAPAGEETKRRYLEALLIQIRSYLGKSDGYIVPSIFVGGGTPSCVEASYINLIMEALKDVFLIDWGRLEATIEVNPGTVSKEKLMTYKEAGFNRLSFGLQSADNKELRLLGRIHSYEQFKDNFYLAREVGFSNINIDLMSALPGQTVASWEGTLSSVINLKPEHISAYSLIIEEGTPFFQRYGEESVGNSILPDEETDRLIYHRTKEILKSNGYDRYEISNYAKEGFECRHNNSYWIGTQYLGLGLGAASLIHNGRFHIVNDLELYIQLCEKYQSNQQVENINDIKWTSDEISKDAIGLYSDFELLKEKDRMEEFMFLGLRLSKGVSKADFFQRFHISIEAIYGNVTRQLLQNGLLISAGDRLKLTEYGIDVSNVVLAEFLLGE